jgi:hypothetical protein
MDEDFRTEDSLIAYLVRFAGCDEVDARQLVRNMMAWRSHDDAAGLLEQNRRIRLP